MSKQRYLYMAVTADELELPVVVAESGRELADAIGCNVNYVYVCISRGGYAANGMGRLGYRLRIYRVPWEED